jgi:hypothetical protein
VPRSKNRVELYLYFPDGPSWPVKMVKPTYLPNIPTHYMNYTKSR